MDTRTQTKTDVNTALPLCRYIENLKRKVNRSAEVLDEDQINTLFGNTLTLLQVCCILIPIEHTDISELTDPDDSPTLINDLDNQYDMM
jgi:hypothetical protein